MFARTERLLLRPGWAEDARRCSSAIADQRIVRNLATAPWPYALRDAEAFLAAPRDPAFRACSSSSGPTARRCWSGLRPRPAAVGRGRTRLLDRPALLGPGHRHRGRSGADRHRPRAGPRAARVRPLPRQSGLGRVLEKLGFKPIGIIAPRLSCARGAEVPARLFPAVAGGGGEAEALAA